ARYNPVVSAPPPTAPAPTPVPTPPPPAVAPAPVPVAPAGYSPAPPPGLVPTALVPPAGAAPSAVPAAPVGYTRSVGIVLSPRLAWADRFITELPPANRIPPPLRWTATIWPHRAAILAGLATLALGLVILQAYRGFGMERAVRQTVAEQFAEQRQKAADSPSKLETIDYAEQQELDKYKLERTTWMYLGIGLHVL